MQSSRKKIFPNTAQAHSRIFDNKYLEAQRLAHEILPEQINDKVYHVSEISKSGINLKNSQFYGYRKNNAQSQAESFSSSPQTFSPQKSLVYEKSKSFITLQEENKRLAAHPLFGRLGQYKSNNDSLDTEKQTQSKKKPTRSSNYGSRSQQQLPLPVQTFQLQQPIKFITPVKLSARQPNLQAMNASLANSRSIYQSQFFNGSQSTNNQNFLQTKPSFVYVNAPSSFRVSPTEQTDYTKKNFQYF